MSKFNFDITAYEWIKKLKETWVLPDIFIRLMVTKDNILLKKVLF